MNTIRDISVELSAKQIGIVNNMLENNPILDQMPVKGASHGFKNVYSEVKSISGVQEVQRDALLPLVNISTALGETTLGKIGGRLPIPKDHAMAVGGYDKFVGSRIPTIVGNGANANENRIYYDGFLRNAVKNGNFEKCGGTTANRQYSMVFVHYDPSSTIGLYNPNSVSNGKLFEQYFLWGGAVGEIELPDGTKCNGKMFCVEMEFGVQMANPDYVGALVNIEPTENATDKRRADGLPSPAQISKALTRVRAGRGNTFIYCHPMMRQWLAIEYNLSLRTVTNETTGMSYTMEYWGDTPIIGSYNVGWGNEAVIA